MDAHTGIFIVLSLLLSFFFSGIEIAFLSANRLHIELKRKQGVLWARIMSHFLKNKTWFIGTVLSGNTLSLVVFGIFTASLLNPFVESWFPASMSSEVLELSVEALISTLVILIFAEFLPKTLFFLNPNMMLSALAVPFQIMYYLFFPFTFTIVKLSRWLIKLMSRINFSEESQTFELADLSHFLSNTRHIKHENKEVEINKEIFSNALAFRTTQLRDCMTPRTDMVAVDMGDGMENLKEAFIRSGHSKVVVYQNDINHVIGYCHQAMLFKKPDRMEDILTSIIPAQETMMAQSLFVQLIKERKSMAVVVDEFGGTSGLVTLEDLIEEIFGEIEDEHDHQELLAVKLDEYSYKLSARLEIEYINERFQLRLPLGDYDTLSGLILEHIREIPGEGTAIIIPPYKFSIQKTSGNKIETVKLTVIGEGKNKD